MYHFLEAINPRAAFGVRHTHETIVWLQNVMNNNPGEIPMPVNLCFSYCLLEYWRGKNAEKYKVLLSDIRYLPPVWDLLAYHIIQMPSIDINICYIDVFPPIVAAELGIADFGTIDCKGDGYSNEAIKCLIMKQNSNLNFIRSSKSRILPSVRYLS